MTATKGALIIAHANVNVNIVDIEMFLKLLLLDVAIVLYRILSHNIVQYYYIVKKTKKLNIFIVLMNCVLYIAYCIAFCFLCSVYRVKYDKLKEGLDNQMIPA